MAGMKHLLAPIASFLILAGCSEAPPPVADTREADTKAIRDVEATALKAWKARSGADLASIYTPDASLMIPNMATVKGSDVSSMMKEMFADPNLSLTFEAAKVEVAKSGELGYSQGAYSMTMSDPKTKKVLTEKGKYVTVFAKQADGSWKAVSDINTPDAPAAPAAKGK
jgi:uncharacterized protein (TIGR02246 family)